MADSTTNVCASVVSDPAVQYVGEAHYKFMALGTSTYDLAVENMAAMTDIVLQPYEFNVSFDYPDPLPVFVRPARPAFDMAALEFRDPGVSIPDAPGYSDSGLVFEQAPDITAAEPVLNFAPMPTDPNIPVPVSPGDVGDLTMPEEPVYVLPEAPTLETLNLPAAPVLTLPLFTATPPVFIEPPFNETWDFVPEAYTHILKDQLLATITPMLQGQEALPPAIELAIFERGRSRIEVEVNRAVETAYQEFAGRGFSEPQGMLSGRIRQVRQDGFNKLSEHARDVSIKQYEETLANLRLALQQGIALEGVYVQLHLEEQRFLLQAAQFQRDSAIAVLNVRLSVYNARMEGYRVEATVFQTLIQAELAKVELYTAQIEGEKARGEINMQSVALYTAQVNAVNSMAEFYRTQVEAVKVEADINRLAFDRYKTEVDAYEARWRAHVAEWQGYTASVEGEGKRADIYKTLVDSQSERVRAWSSEQSFKVEAAKLGLSEHDQKLKVWASGIDRYRALLGAEAARLNAAGQGITAQASVYRADADIEQVASAAGDRTFELGLRREQAEVDVQLREAEMHIAQARQLTDQLIAIRNALMQTSSQLAASTMSAVGYSAGLSSSHGYSRSCSTSFNYSGEIVDA